jgi:transposase InsO family protein
MKWNLFGKKTRHYKKRKQIVEKKSYTVEEKLKLIQEFEKIGGSIQMFANLYGVNFKTLQTWIDRYRAEGETGLESKYGKRKEEVPEAVKEEIVKLKQEHPTMGAHKISEFLKRNKFVKVYAAKVMEILKGNPTTALLIAQKAPMHGNSGKDPVSFERSKARQMYQMDIMTYMLKGLYRVYVIACMDDYSRYVVSIGLFRSQTSEKAVDVLRAAIERYGTPEEVLTDNGRQFYTWRGKSKFQTYVMKSGISHIRSRPYHPQTLGKVESLWRNMYQELFTKVPLPSFEEAEKKLKEWIEWYNYKRPHQGIGGLAPADRFFGVEKGMKEIMEKGAGMVKDALLIDPRRIKEPIYLLGKIGGKEIKIIAKEGNITVEGLDGIEEKVIESKEKEKKTGGEYGNGGKPEEPIRGDNVTGESQEETDGIGKTDECDVGDKEGKTDERSEPGNGVEPGNAADIEKESDKRDERSA